MRLDEWQKFIESQFLDDEQDQVPPETPSPVATPPESHNRVLARPAPLTAVPQPPTITPKTENVFLPVVRNPAPATIVSEPNRPSNTAPIAPPITNYRTPSGTGEPTRLSSTAKESAPAPAPNLWGMETEIPEFDDFLAKKPAPPQVEVKRLSIEEQPSLPLLDTPALSKPRRTVKYRAKHAKNVRPESVHQGLSIVEFWEGVPRHVQQLVELGQQNEAEVAQYSYKRPFAEQRQELIERILDPIISLEDCARLLNVCPTTVRRYTNRGILTCYRKEVENSSRDAGSVERETRQRRFRLSDILAFLEAQQSTLEADRKADALRLYPANNSIEVKE